MDGGSTDGSVQIIKKYEPYLTYWVSERDGGQSDAIRRGFQNCRGKILAYLNSDDVYLPGTLLSVARAVQNDPSAGVLYGNLYQIDEGDQIIGDERLTSYIPFLSRLGMLYGGFGIYQPASFWTRDLYDRVGGIDPSFVHCMDNDLFVRLSLADARFMFIRAPLAAIRRHASAKTATLRHIAETETQLIKSKYSNRRVEFLGPTFTALTKVVRAVLYAAQGDGAYLCKKKLARKLALRS
jgi:glycosyltransferase involved in cell wall biosynthesis